MFPSTLFLHRAFIGQQKVAWSLVRRVSKRMNMRLSGLETRSTAALESGATMFLTYGTVNGRKPSYGNKPVGEVTVDGWVRNI